MSFTDDADNEETLTSGATAAARPNSPATGQPTISGIAHAGQTLTAGTAGIADADGLDDAIFSYQWIANDGTTDMDIEDADDSTYTVSDDDVGQVINVRVSFTGDAGTEVTLPGPPFRRPGACTLRTPGWPAGPPAPANGRRRCPPSPQERWAGCSWGAQGAGSAADRSVFPVRIPQHP